MSKHVVFISLPMSGIPDDIVRQHIDEAKLYYLTQSGRRIEDVVFVNTMDNPDPPDYCTGNRQGVWYLGHSLIKLCACDEIFFYIGWEKARGCYIEREVALTYGIPIKDMEV